MVLHNLDLPEDERNWGEVDQALDVTTDDEQGLVDVILLRTSIQVAQNQVDLAREIL